MIDSYYSSSLHKECKEKMNDRFTKYETEDPDGIKDLRDKYNTAFDELSKKEFSEKLEMCSNFKELDINSSDELTAALE